jgi:hypothetical protein
MVTAAAGGILFLCDEWERSAWLPAPRIGFGCSPGLVRYIVFRFEV